MYIAATFQNGELKSNQVDKLQCLALQDKQTNKRIITSATENMVYTGSDDMNEDLCYTLLTIRNKRTNKVCT